MPLKLQHQLSQTMSECLDKKAKLRFFELNNIMTEVLREDIIRDCGHPKLKAKCLDLITKLRIEASILNESKTGKAKDPPPKLQNTKEFNDQDDKVIGLDENGQIKINHGVEEIKEMLQKGLLKAKGSRTRDSSQLTPMLQSAQALEKITPQKEPNVEPVAQRAQ